ncbi:LytR C-terminal domain-containing protein [Corynebacterium gerontici]
MILIAVAVLLVGWGIYASKKDSEPVASTSIAESPTQTQTQAETPPQSETEEQSPVPPAAPPVETVKVLNNSTVQGMAATVADKLAAEGWKKGEVGNYADAVVPQNTVYFDSANPNAEQAARKLADRVGGVAQAGQPAGTEDPNVLVLVLAKDIP